MGIGYECAALEAKRSSHKKTVQKYLRSSLDKNLPKAIRGKYNEMLMSILSIVTISVSFSLSFRDFSNDPLGIQ